MNAPHQSITPDRFDAVLFDLDGVLTSTAKIHSSCWKTVFDDFLRHRAAEKKEAFRPFEIATDYKRYVDGKLRYEGVRSFLASRGIALADGDIPRHALEMLARDHWPHVDLGTSVSRAHFHSSGGLAEPIDQRIGDLADRYRDAACHAALARTTKRRELERAHSLVEIGIGHDDQMVFGAARRLHSLAVLRSRRIDVAGDRRRADKRDRSHKGMNK